MAHYLDINSIDKDLVEGIKVISCLDNERFKEKMVSILEIVRCGFNDVFRNYFDVNPQWDGKVSSTTKCKEIKINNR